MEESVAYKDSITEEAPVCHWHNTEALSASPTTKNGTTMFGPGNQTVVGDATVPPCLIFAMKAGANDERLGIRIKSSGRG